VKEAFLKIAPIVFPAIDETFLLLLLMERPRLFANSRRRLYDIENQSCRQAERRGLR
jgi:hypothetical protein